MPDLEYLSWGLAKENHSLSTKAINEGIMFIPTPDFQLPFHRQDPQDHRLALHNPNEESATCRSQIERFLGVVHLQVSGEVQQLAHNLIFCFWAPLTMQQRPQWKEISTSTYIFHLNDTAKSNSGGEGWVQKNRSLKTGPTRSGTFSLKSRYISSLWWHLQSAMWWVCGAKHVSKEDLCWGNREILTRWYMLSANIVSFRRWGQRFVVHPQLYKQLEHLSQHIAVPKSVGQTSEREPQWPFSYGVQAESHVRQIV